MQYNDRSPLENMFGAPSGLAFFFHSEIMRNPPPRSISTWRLFEPVIVDYMYPKNIHGLWKKSAWFWRGGEQWSGQFDSHFYNSHSKSAPKHRTWKRLMSLLKQTSGVVNIVRHDQQCATSRYDHLLWNKLKKRLDCLNWASVKIKDNIRNYTTWNSK